LSHLGEVNIVAARQSQRVIREQGYIGRGLRHGSDRSIGSDTYRASFSVRMLRLCGNILHSFHSPGQRILDRSSEVKV